MRIKAILKIYYIRVICRKCLKTKIKENTSNKVGLQNKNIILVIINMNKNLNHLKKNNMIKRYYLK